MFISSIYLTKFNLRYLLFIARQHVMYAEYPYCSSKSVANPCVNFDLMFTVLRSSFHGHDSAVPQGASYRNSRRHQSLRHVAALCCTENGTKALLSHAVTVSVMLGNSVCWTARALLSRCVIFSGARQRN